MRKLVVCALMSLDGYVEGPGKNFMVMPADHSFDGYCAERLREAGTLLLGRTTFEMFRGFWPSVAGNENATADQREISRLDNAIEKVVVSDTLTRARTAPWDDAAIVSRSEAHTRISALKKAPGRDILVFGSNVLWNDLLKAGLVDELHLMVGPAVLGSGTPAFGKTPDAPLRLLTNRTFADSSNIVLQYGVG
ncbi:dihydrofolate reductase family protein [Actinomadura graeca]|uniref:Dihydrofolate reductase family protein n=1 Tax=Actinomadura graeca TaxID=2750812 RepID=A0ABX8QWQ8_9ACTN|nr:dihydrofolate reductase family protein [Actinomadura graeca]QXJ23290.1 dihydrofolate reductase family protein [Actinomadura graeca]